MRHNTGKGKERDAKPQVKVFVLPLRPFKLKSIIFYCEFTAEFICVQY